MSNLFHTYNQFPMEIVDGHDWTLIDNQQKEYLDFTSGIGVCSFGYSNELINHLVTNQIGKVWHTSNLYPSQAQEEVAKLLCPDGMVAFFCNSGTEANEAAFKLARKATGKTNVIAFKNGFHGRTYGSMSLTGNSHISEGFAPLVPNVEFAEYNSESAFEQVTDDTAAVILEVVQGEGGVVLADKQWLTELQEVCHQCGALMIVDEVQTGIGRTGTKFAYEQFGIEPDIITCAKALGNGLPVGAMLGKEKLVPAFGPGSHGTTFGGNKVSMAAAKGVLQQLTPEFLDSVSQKANVLKEELAVQIKPLPVVKSISQLGMMVGIKLDDQVAVADVIADLQKAGMLTLSAEHNTLRLLPPLIISEGDIVFGVEKIKSSLKNVMVVEEQ
ncbi:acetylornithine transaminase [Lentilactobacillus sp. Marseille-Q4993]|uniref:acetylornithine transaminase n=1 Tax=Lentilactobacillus sp. Marseille-Q4993 TaxID=3039492 RepID=UPI0024BCF763|nr:acetylornithine transaminase [Lentilactobacillus sp. Marseille-Q4993]